MKLTVLNVTAIVFRLMEPLVKNSRKKIHNFTEKILIHDSAGKLIEWLIDNNWEEHGVKVFLVSWNFVASDGTQTTIFDYNPNKGKEGVTVNQKYSEYWGINVECVFPMFDKICFSFCPNSESNRLQATAIAKTYPTSIHLTVKF